MERLAASVAVLAFVGLGLGPGGRSAEPVTIFSRPGVLYGSVDSPRAGEAVSIQESLEKRRLTSRLVLIPDEGHGSAKRSNQVITLGHILRFFEEHLKPKPGPAQD